MDQMYQMYGFVPRPFEKHRSLAISSIVLGALASVCCMTTGFGIVPAFIGTVFGVIAIARGSAKARRLGIVGLILSAVGLIINGIVILWLVSIVDWGRINWDLLMSAVNVDANDPNEILEWLQQFIKVDITSL